MIYENIHCGNLLAKFNGYHVNLAFNAKKFMQEFFLQNVTNQQLFLLTVQDYIQILWMWMFDATIYAWMFLWMISLQACKRHIQWKIAHKNGSPCVSWMRPNTSLFCVCVFPRKSWKFQISKLRKTSISWQNNAYIYIKWLNNTQEPWPGK